MRTGRENFSPREKLIDDLSGFWVKSYFDHLGHLFELFDNCEVVLTKGVPNGLNFKCEDISHIKKFIDYHTQLTCNLKSLIDQANISIQ